MTHRVSKQVKICLLALSAGAVLVGVGMGNVVAGPSIDREGSASHQSALRAIESKAFDVALFGGLDSWTLAQPLNAKEIEGKVVLVGLVSIDDVQSMKTLSSFARYQRQHEAKGLVILAVHPDAGWDSLNEKVQDGRVKVQVARDVDGAFAKAIVSDDYPDLYLIDRAGQLRFADIETRSLLPAMTQLLRETQEQAIENAVRESAANEVLAPQSSDEDSGEAGEDTAKPMATREAYASAAWPATNSGTIKARNIQGQTLQVPLGNEEWITERVELDGKVLVLDFWATWCGPCIRASPMLDQMQTQHPDTLAILAIGGQSDPESKVRAYVAEHKVSYSHLYDTNQSIYRNLQVTAIPHTLIISTDGVVRWQGNPLSADFKAALEQVLRVDPMINE